MVKDAVIASMRTDESMAPEERLSNQNTWQRHLTQTAAYKYIKTKKKEK